MTDWIEKLDHTWPHQCYIDKLLGIGEIYEMLTWCKTNCQSEVLSTPNQTWYFQNEQDCLMFVLRWTQ